MKNTPNASTSSANTSIASTSSAKRVKTRFLERFTQEKDNLDPRLIEEPTVVDTGKLLGFLTFFCQFLTIFKANLVVYFRS